MKLFTFGEKVKGYEVPVLNEREVRAGAGILFFFAVVSFMHVWLLGDFFYMKLFVTGFLMDFLIRLVINPLYSPILIVGRFATQNQKVEYVGARQKRFAWVIGLVLSLVMFWRVVLVGVVGPLNLLICVACLLFLFFESALGICLGCHMYNLIYKEKAQFCPGGVCEIHAKEPIQSIGFVHLVFVVLFGVIMFFTYQQVKSVESNQVNGVQDCVVPQWAKDLGHEDQYKLHHGCG